MEKKIPFTKIIMAVMLLCNAALIAFTCVMVWRTSDLSPLGWLAIGEGGAMSVWLNTYGRKEGSANNSKYAMEFVDKYAEKYGPDTAIRVAEIVLQNQGG